MRAAYVCPVPREALPGLVTKQRVTHGMEKELRGEWFSLRIVCQSVADSYQEAERALWQGSGSRWSSEARTGEAEPSRLPACQPVERFAVIEPTDLPAWLREGTAVSPLIQTLALLRPLLSLGLLDVPEGSVLAPITSHQTRSLWTAAFLARGVPSPDVIRAQLPIVRTAAEHLTQGRVCGVAELLAEWGVLYQTEATPAAPKAFPTSGSMPRFFKPAAAHAARFVARPKLFMVPDEGAQWSWQQDASAGPSSAAPKALAKQAL